MWLSSRVIGVAAFALLAAGAFAEELYLDIPLRKQWMANSGYCGEASLVAAGLYYGQYCSQFTARRMAAPGVDQSRPQSWLLLGVNDLSAAKRMGLRAETFVLSKKTSCRDFLAWVKSHIAARCPVIIGVFYNMRRFGDPLPGDREYDHIVPVVGIRSSRPICANRQSFFASDQIVFSDNGLYDPSGTPRFRFRSAFSRFPRSRRAANEVDAPLYSLKSRPYHYGIAITGVADPDGATVPVRLAASRRDEPRMVDGSHEPPTPGALRLVATVTLPDPSLAYNVYRYDDFDKVPVRAFNANSGRAAQAWRIPPHSGKIVRFIHQTNTGAAVVFRAVPVTAP